MRRKVEQEGYLQSVIKSESASSAELQPQPCLTMEHLHTQNQFFVPVQTHVSSKLRIISISQFQIIETGILFETRNKTGRLKSC